MAIYYTGTQVGNQVNFSTGEASAVARDVKQHIINQLVTGGETGLAPSNKAVYDFGTGISGYLSTNGGGLYQLSALSTGTDIAAINLTGRVSGQSFIDSVTISGGAGLDLSVSADAITISHTDTSSVADLTVNAAAGSAITGIVFTYDTFGHVVTAAATSSTLVQDFIFSGVSVVAPSQNAVYGLSGYLANNAGGSYQINATESLLDPSENVAQINLTGRVSGSAFNDFIKIKGTGGIEIGVSATGDDTVYIGHSDTSSVANLSVSASAGSAVAGVSFTFDTYGHVANASATTQTIVRNQIQSGVTTTAPSEGAVYSLSGSLQSQINTANALTLQSVTNNGSTTTNGISIGGNLVTSGNVTLGNDASDTLTINAGPIVLTNAVTGGDALIFGPNNGSEVSLYKSDFNTLRVEGALIVTGNLTVRGTTTTIDSNVVSVGDSTIMLNGDFTGSVPSENAGIEVERGTQTNTSLLWNEGTDRWTFTNNGTGYFNIPVTSEYATYDIVVAAGGSNDAYIRITGSNGDVNDILIVGSNGILVTDNGVNTINVSHEDTSAASSITAANSVGSAVQSFSGLLDTYGHVTGLQVQSVNLDNLYPRTGQVVLDYVTDNGAITDNDITIGGLTVSGSSRVRSDHFVMYCSTADSTVTEMFLNGTVGRITLATNSVVSFKGQITAFDELAYEAASWNYDCVIANKAGNSAIVGAAHVTKLGADNGTWEVYVDADNTFDSLKLQVKGPSVGSTLITWAASVITTVVRTS